PLGNLMHRQALGNRNRDHDEIAIDQMAHHVGNPLATLEGIVPRLDLTGSQTHPPIKPQRQPTPNHPRILQIPRYLPKRLSLLNRNLPLRHKPFGRTQPKIRERSISSTDRDNRDQSHHDRKPESPGRGIRHRQRPVREPAAREIPRKSILSTKNRNTQSLSNFSAVVRG